jgi:hypothetical protein
MPAAGFINRADIPEDVSTSSPHAFGVDDIEFLSQIPLSKTPFSTWITSIKRKWDTSA